MGIVKRFAILSSLLFLLFPQSVVASSIVLNEIMPHPFSGADWIEIYNPTTEAIDLTSWTLVDSTSTIKTLNGSIPADGFINFDVSNRLNNSGDSIYLKDKLGAEIDNYSYTSDPGVDVSLGRVPDGGNWAILAQSSKGDTNENSSIITPTPTPSPTPTPTKNPTPTKSPTPTKTPTPTKPTTTSSVAKKTPTPTGKITSDPKPQIPQGLQASSLEVASVAGEKIENTKSQGKSFKQITLITFGALSILLGSGIIAYLIKRR